MNSIPAGSTPLVGSLPTLDQNGIPIKYEYVDIPSEQELIKKRVERKRGVKHITEDVIIEVPDISYKDVVRKVPITMETAVEFPEKKVHIRQIQEIRRVPKIVERKIPKRVEVRGAPQEIKVLNEIITHNPITKYISKEQPVVVAQTVKPQIKVTDQIVEIQVSRLTPRVNYVDVHVALPIKRNQDFKVTKDEHFQKPAKVPESQYNSLLIAMNGHLSEDQLQDLPFKRTVQGEINVCPEEMNAILLDASDAQRLGITTRAPKEVFPRGKRQGQDQRIYSQTGSDRMSVLPRHSGARLVSEMEHIPITTTSHVSGNNSYDIGHGFNASVSPIATTLGGSPVRI